MAATAAARMRRLRADSGRARGVVSGIGGASVAGAGRVTQASSAGLPAWGAGSMVRRMPTPGERLVSLLRADPPDATAIADLLTRLAPNARRDAIAALSGPRLQRTLYEVMAGSARVTLADL